MREYIAPNYAPNKLQQEIEKLQAALQAYENIHRVLKSVGSCEDAYLAGTHTAEAYKHTSLLLKSKLRQSKALGNIEQVIEAELEDEHGNGEIG